LCTEVADDDNIEGLRDFKLDMLPDKEKGTMFPVVLGIEPPYIAIITMVS
jgi:hypothetical protein